MDIYSNHYEKMLRIKKMFRLVVPIDILGIPEGATGYVCDVSKERQEHSGIEWIIWDRYENEGLYPFNERFEVVKDFGVEVKKKESKCGCFLPLRKNVYLGIGPAAETICVCRLCKREF